MQILALVSGEFGQRNIRNIQAFAPEDWVINTWQTPPALPPMIDYPEDHLPDSFPESDLILSFAELKGVAELLPEIARLSKAKAVIVAVNNEAWLPLGLARQLRGWLADMNVACATDRIKFESPEISEFARYFGRPDLKIVLDEKNQAIRSAEVIRDAVCGNTRHVAGQIIGLPTADVLYKAGLLHKHFPCLTTMTKLDDFDHETLMQESGYQLTDNIAGQLNLD